MANRPLHKIGHQNVYASLMGSLLICLMAIGCASTKKIEDSTRVDVGSTRTQHNNGTSATTEYNVDFDNHDYISLKPPNLSIANDSLEPIELSTTAAVMALNVGLNDSSPVAYKIVENYQMSQNKEPNGNCLTVSKRRFDKAYKEIHGHSPYKDLPRGMASKYDSPRQVFNLLYVSASEKSQRWRSLPKKYRGKGNAGAIAYAGMGTLMNASEIWGGQLQPGALVQVWRFQEDYEQVVKGANVKKLDPYGHSFIFISYERDELNNIIGLTIADQGFQSYRPLIRSDYEVWWGVNLSI